MLNIIITAEIFIYVSSVRIPSSISTQFLKSIFFGMGTTYVSCCIYYKLPSGIVSLAPLKHKGPSSYGLKAALTNVFILFPCGNISGEGLKYKNGPHEILEKIDTCYFTD